MNTIPVGVIFAATVVLVVGSVEAGWRLGHAFHRRSKDEKESPVSAVSAAILGLLAFILAFTFNIVYDRFDTKKALVREEANMIRTAWSRSDFLPEADRVEAANLLRDYVDLRLTAAQSGDLDRAANAIDESVRIQRKLWDTAVENARKDMNSDVAALYIESLNEMNNLQALRVAVGLQVRIPAGLWFLLYVLIVFGMIGFGYQIATVGSFRRLLVTLILAISFSTVIMTIVSLDRPQSGFQAAFMKVPQQPLKDLRKSMDARLE
jgi:hypothetical protein